jgi:hypothetical protein
MTTSSIGNNYKDINKVYVLTILYPVVLSVLAAGLDELLPNPVVEVFLVVAALALTSANC